MKSKHTAALCLSLLTAFGMTLSPQTNRPDLIASADLRGDADGSGTLDAADAVRLRDYLICETAELNAAGANLDGNGKISAVDLTLLKRILIQNGQQQTTAPSAYMSQVRASYVTELPQLAQGGGTMNHISYFSKKANKEKPANVWLPPDYNPSEQYPVFYVNHGIQGNEYTMLGDFKILESATTLIASGEAVPMIIVFTFMYTNPNKDNCDGITADEVTYYDAFLDDLTDSLMPYIESNYSCKTGRENTAIGGFSMGGRESLYIGIMRPDLFGYIAASSPAPGVVPARDHFMEHVGSISEDQFRMSEPYLPYLLMIAGGTADGMVGDFPEQYHKLFEKNGTDHIWISVPGGGHDGGVGAPLFYNFIRALFQA